MLSPDAAVRLVGATYIFAVVFWFALEIGVASKYTSRYSWTAHMISDLGVPYEFFGITNDTEFSPLSRWMNINFMASAALYTIPQWILLYNTRGRGPNDGLLKVARAACAGLFFVGLITVGVVHGGPTEHANGDVKIHEFGATSALLGGNICSILAGVSSTQVEPVATIGSHYRLTSIVLGLSGIAASVALVTITPPTHFGTVERVAVYVILGWELLTGVYLFRKRKEITTKTKAG